MEKGASSNGTSPAAKMAVVDGEATAEREAKALQGTEERVTELVAQMAYIRLGREEAQRYMAEREARPRRRPATEQRVAELEAQLAFGKALFAEARRYAAMEEDVVEEYRRAGKLHTYDPNKEWQKRAARVARVYPPPKHLAARIAEYMKYLDEEEVEEEDE